MASLSTWRLTTGGPHSTLRLERAHQSSAQWNRLQNTKRGGEGFCDRTNNKECRGRHLLYRFSSNSEANMSQDIRCHFLEHEKETRLYFLFFSFLLLPISTVPRRFGSYGCYWFLLLTCREMQNWSEWTVSTLDLSAGLLRGMLWLKRTGRQEDPCLDGLNPLWRLFCCFFCSMHGKLCTYIYIYIVSSFHWKRAHSAFSEVRNGR